MRSTPDGARLSPTAERDREIVDITDPVDHRSWPPSRATRRPNHCSMATMRPSTDAAQYRCGPVPMRPSTDAAIDGAGTYALAIKPNSAGVVSSGFFGSTRTV
jgi:hypothetical protein